MTVKCAIALCAAVLSAAGVEAAAPWSPSLQEATGSSVGTNASEDAAAPWQLSLQEEAGSGANTCPGQCICLPCPKDAGSCLLWCNGHGGPATCGQDSRCHCGAGYCAAADKHTCDKAAFEQDPRCGASESKGICKCVPTTTTPAPPCSAGPVGTCLWWCVEHGSAHCVDHKCYCKEGTCADHAQNTCVPKSTMLWGEEEDAQSLLWEGEFYGGEDKGELAEEHLAEASSLPAFLLAIAVGAVAAFMLCVACARHNNAVHDVPLLEA